MNAPLAPWIGRFTETVAAEMRAMRMRAYDRDTETLHQGRRIEATRIAWYAGYQRYEPDAGVPDGD